jgi:hypothetical protein
LPAESGGPVDVEKIYGHRVCRLLRSLGPAW